MILRTVYPSFNYHIVIQTGGTKPARRGEYVRGNLKEWLREVEPSSGRQDLLTTGQYENRMDRVDERFSYT